MGGNRMGKLTNFFLQVMEPNFGAPKVSDSAALSQNRNREATNATLRRLSNQFTQNNGDSSNELVGRNTPIGIDAVVQDWVRQTFIFRRSILQDMFIMALQVTEIRAALMSIKRGVFKRELGRWVPRFKTMCVTCGKKYQTKETECDACYLQTDKIVWRYDRNNVPYRAIEPEFVFDEKGGVIPSPTREPDEEQKDVFEDFKEDVNIFHQSLLDVMREAFEDLLVTDDLFILMNKEYTVDRKTGYVTSQRVFEVTRLHPALVEFDIDRKDGLPERSHYLCPLHRNQSVGTAPGRCAFMVGEGMLCNTVLLPAMFRYYIRGHYRYYTRDEIIHKSYFSPSKSYGYASCLSTTEWLTKDGFKKFNEIFSDDELLTVNPDTYDLEYVPYTQKWSQSYKGKAHHIVGSHIDQLVTPQHRMLINRDSDGGFELDSAENIIGTNYYYRSNFNWTGEEQEYFTLPEINHHYIHPVPEISEVDMPYEMWAELMGLFIARGSYHKKGIMLSYNSYNDTSIQEVLDRTGYHWDKQRVMFRWANKAVADYISKDKEEIIEEFSSYAPEIREIFAQSALRWIEDSKSVRTVKAVQYEDRLNEILNDDSEGLEVSPRVQFSLVPLRTNHYPEMKIKMDDWLAFFGWYIAEGSVSKSGTGWGVMMPQTLGRPNRWHMEKSCDALPFTWGRDDVQMWMTSRQLAEYLDQFGHSYQKYVPDYVKGLSSRQIGIFLDAFHRGDGETNGNRLFTTSDKLRDNLMELGLKSGFTTFYKKKPNGTKEHHRYLNYITLSSVKSLEKIKSEIIDFDDEMMCLLPRLESDWFCQHSSMGHK